MMDPVGPLPASVYWRRRLVAVVAALVGLFGLLWLVTAALLPSGVDSDDSTTGRAAHVEQSTASPTPGPPGPDGTGPTAAPGTPGAPTTLPAPGTPAPGAPPGTSAGPAAPSAGPVDETVRPDPAALPPVVVPSGPAPPTGPPPCSDRMIAVRAETDRPEYRVGERPVLRLVVTNVADQPCVRDLDGAQQEVVVWSGDGANRLWSSNDCVNPSSNDLRTLLPGQPVAFAVTWSGLGSAPGCAKERDRIPPGAYRVLTRLGPVISPPAPFLLSP